MSIILLIICLVIDNHPTIAYSLLRVYNLTIELFMRKCFLICDGNKSDFYSFIKGDNHEKTRYAYVLLVYFDEFICVRK